MKIGEMAYPHIVKKADEPARLESHPRTRVADYLWRGWSTEEIVRHYPYLTLVEVHATLGYYFDHREEIDNKELLEESRGVDAWRKSHPTASEFSSIEAGRSVNLGIATALSADVQVSGPVILQSPARSEHCGGKSCTSAKTDEELLDILTASSRVVLTQDIRFACWLKTGSVQAAVLPVCLCPSEEREFW